ncbi:MAG: VCBS repeat-containing protein, partial [Isosphaeraceae bacterium]|nr:VCBS repeat-containing protein [Isosphaeraceae bacterium]
LEQGRREIERGDYAAAEARLVPLPRGAGRGEVDYLLGLCAERAGRSDDALAAWSRVPAASPFAALAALRRGSKERERGRLADAEASFATALRAGGPQVHEARQRLAEVLWAQGRFDEVRALVEANWVEASQPGWPDPNEADALLAFCLALDLNPLPTERIRSTLDHDAALAPQDDRVWLGRANLAIRSGDFAEAERWLDACQGRRPEDPAVWRARLAWALATDRVEPARQALRHLQAEYVPEGRLWSLRAWFAARRGDADAEQEALERVIAIDPGDLGALERLAELATRAGRVEPALSYRQRKAALDEALHRYRGLVRGGDPRRDADEMARLAERLGRRFEARALWTRVRRQDPDDTEARVALGRLSRVEPPRPPLGQALADLLASDSGPPASRSVSSHPITPRPPSFRDEAQAAGLRFTFESGASPAHQLPEVMSGGLGLLDYDGDGWLDVYCVQGGPFPPLGDSDSSRPGDRLFRNRGNGTFEDATAAAGLAELAHGYGHGVAVGDYDNDGHPDLFVTRWRSYALYRNRGDGTFENATTSAGLAGDRDWPTSAAFADLDNDGDLDLYVCHYLAWDAEDPRICRSPATGRVISCDPRGFAALPDHVFRNEGGRFVDVTAEAGIIDRDGRGLGVVAADCDDDGQIDLYVANDGTANYLFRNLGGFRFEEVGHASGVAANAEGGYQAGMGVAGRALDGDRRPALAVTNFFGESTTFYHNLGGGLFADRTAAVGLAAPSRYKLGFGIAFLDADNDGWLDLLTANGHVADERPEIPYAMPAQLLLGDARGHLVDVSTQAGAPFQAPHLGRGLAAGDLDNDGRVDALIVAQDEPLVYLHNRTEGGHALTIQLEGTASNRDGLGARVTIEASGRRLVAWRHGGGSYQAASDPRLHFGLGAAQRIETLEVRWPSGHVDRLRDLNADRIYLVREGEPSAQPLDSYTNNK